MLLTVTIGTPKYLCVQDNCLVIKERHEDNVLDKIPLSDIWVIIIDNGTADKKLDHQVRFGVEWV